ncbi:MAG: chromate transporter, partial [Candidatus Omnitrophica bacterium]|nr:chromate transporter [Candidatus Omnitrophota bacterium]
VGLIVAGGCFLGPAILLTLLWAYLYESFGSTPALLPVLKGIKPAVLIIILGAVFRLARKALKSWQMAVIGGAVLLLALLGYNEILLLFAGGILGATWLFLSKRRSGLNCISPIFLIFLKIGAVLYGSGYLLIAYLEAEFVDQRGWLTHQQLLDAVAAGQLTPGPVLSTATFIGYQLQGLQGALLATAGIFLPSFLFVYFLNPFVSKMRGQPVAAAFLDSVNISAVSLMLAVCAKLLFQVLTDIPGLILMLVLATVFVTIPRLSPVGLLVLGGLGGLLAEWMPL